MLYLNIIEQDCSLKLYKKVTQILIPLSQHGIRANENSALVLVSQALDVTNYHPWTKIMKITLLSKNKIKFIDGTLPTPARDAIRLWFLGSRNDFPLPLPKASFGSTKPLKCKKILKKDFHKEICSESQICKKISTLINNVTWLLLSTLLALKSYGMKCWIIGPYLRVLVSILAIVVPLLHLKPIKKNDYVIWFLKGLNESFANIRSQIMLMEHLPSINKVFSLVVQQER